MAKFQFFYDYECPYCKTGYEELLEQLKGYPETEIEWIPMESHPAPENHRPHTALCVQGFYIAREMGADMAAFHALLFQAVSSERRNVEDPGVLASVVQGILDKDKFLSALNAGKYRSKVGENNDLAYEKMGVWFVPAFRSGSLKLDAKGGIGVSKAELKDFLGRLAKGGA